MVGRVAEPAVVQRSDAMIWVLVGLATLSVVALAVSQGRRSRQPGFDGKTPPPAFSLPSLDGKKTPLPQGRVTLVDFWATWCEPCRVSMPRVQEIWRKYQPAGLELYSVDTDDANPDRDPEVREFLMKNGLTFPVVLDDGTATSAFKVSNLPTMLLLDKSGKVVWSDVGQLTGARERSLVASIEKALR
jgi:thiol-disulfide isomerase/thioredoxin